MPDRAGHADLLSLNALSQMTLTRRTVGADRTPLLVVDNLFRDPEKVRSFALSLQYETPLPGDGWPGVQAAASLDRSELVRFVKDHFVHDRFGMDPSAYRFPAVRSGEKPDQWSAFFLQSRFGLITMTAEEAPGVAHPHVDEFGFAAAVIYLCAPARCHGGTVLCRHRGTGIQTLPPFAADLPLSLVHRLTHTQSYSTVAEMLSKQPQASAGPPGQRRILTREQQESVWNRLMEGAPSPRRYMTESDSHWEILEQVDMRFNRLVVYPTWQLHGINWDMSFSGPQKSEQRLTMMDWLNYPVPATASEFEDASAEPRRLTRDEKRTGR